MKNQIKFATSALCICCLTAPAVAEVRRERIYLDSNQTVEYTGAYLVGFVAPDPGVGGAVYNNTGTLKIGNGSVFEDNYASSMASIIYNAGAANLTIGDNAVFKYNTVMEFGGVMNQGGSTLAIGNNAQFISNQTLIANSVGATLFNQEATMTVGDGALFQNNRAVTSGAAVYQQVRPGFADSASLTIGTGSQFVNNSAGTGGAIYNYNAGTSDATVNLGANAQFINNSATVTHGGAVANWLGTFTIGDNATFAGNTSVSKAGALINEGKMMFLGTSLFTGNATYGHGGALVNSNQMNSSGSFITFTDDAIFTLNNASTYGGAVVNETTMNFAKNATFTNNTANRFGGAIVNTGTLNFGGNVTFSENMAAGIANDIANGGEINFANNTTIEFDGGITKTGSNASIVTFGDNTKLSAKLSSTPFITADTVNVGTNSVIDKLIISGGAVGDNVELVRGTMNGDFVFNSANFKNNLYDVSYTGGGKFNVTQKATDVIASKMGADVTAVATAQAVTTGTSTNQTFNKIQDNISMALQSDNPAEFKAGLDAAKKLAPTSAPVTQANTTQISTQIFNVAGDRFAGNSSIAPMGMSSGDFQFGDFKIWGTGLYNYSKLHQNNGFHANSRGFAAGVEADTGVMMLGGGYAYTTSDVHMSDRDTDIKSNTAILYAQYKPNQWYGNIVASYTFGKNEDMRQVMGVALESENDVNSLAVQGMVGYDFFMPESYMVDVVSTEVGVRYINADMADYTDVAGTFNQGYTADVMTAVAKLKFDTARFLSPNLVFKPKFNFGLTYDFLRDDITSVVTLANGSVFSVTGESLNRFGSEVELGIGFLINEQLDMAVSYQGRFRSHYEDHSAILNLRYIF